MTLHRKLIVLAIDYDDEDFTDPETWDWTRRVGMPFNVELVAAGDMGEVLMPNFEGLEDDDDGDCEITNCHQRAIRSIRGRVLCQEHLDDFRELLNTEE